MFHTPAHKAGSISPAQTISDQIARHEQYDPPKLSFEEWAQKNFAYNTLMGDNLYHALKRAWKASRENL
ncbi:MAG TPA: hypothetical protein VFM18_07835 [Methanosarcina sp.]|nr:hypothetical protein [Methanosarcina sp.]